jgi:hypothetical protein
MRRRLKMPLVGMTLALIMAWGGDVALAKGSHGGGGHSYSSHSSSFSSSSHSFSSGGHSYSSGSHTFSSGSHSSSSFSSSRSSGSSGTSYRSGSGKSYSSGSSGNGSTTRSYSSGKSYSSGAGHSSWYSDSPSTARTTPASDFAFDNGAARARKQQSSKSSFDQYKDSQRPAAPPPISATPTPTRVFSSGRSSTWYVPDSSVLVTRRVRVYNVFNPYWSRPVVVYHDPYNSFFWWWLLDRSLDDRAWWAYNHQYDMDPSRYQALLATDQQLQARVAQLEAQQATRDPNYVPPGLDRDLMYSDQYVSHAYSNRPTTAGRAAFWTLGIPVALGSCGLFIWLIWFKRW